MVFKLQWVFFFSLILSELAGSLIFAVTPMNAQNLSSPRSLPALPQDIQPPSLPPPESELLPSLPPPEDLLRPPSTSETPENPSVAPGTMTDMIAVKRFEVVGNTVFTPEVLNKVTEPFTHRPLSFVELLQVADAITRLYQEQGYITSGAFIPPQEIQDGIVIIQVIEGRLDSINVTGLKRLQPDYVRSRIAITTKPPLNVNRLLQALQFLQLNPLIANLSAELSAGSRPGLSILEVQVEEAPALAAQLRFDNEQVTSVGTNRRIVELDHANLLGFGDRFKVRYYNTDGSNALDDLSYILPINPDNGSIGFRYRTLTSKVIQEPFNELHINSDYQEYELTYRQPIWQTTQEEIALGLSFDRQKSNTSLLDILKSKTRLSALRFFQEYIDRTEQQVFVVNSQFNWGIEGFNQDFNGTRFDRGFFDWKGQAQYFRLLTRDTSLLLRTEIQFSANALLPQEQFGLGGLSSVRGYPQEIILADNGIFVSLEARATILRIADWKTSLQLASFFDFGTAWNVDGTPLLKHSLYSVGLALELIVGNNFNARIDWGIPLVTLDTPQNNLQENGLYFVVEYKQKF